MKNPEKFSLGASGLLSMKRNGDLEQGLFPTKYKIPLSKGTCCGSGRFGLKNQENWWDKMNFLGVGNPNTVKNSQIKTRSESPKMLWNFTEIPEDNPDFFFLLFFCGKNQSFGKIPEILAEIPKYFRRSWEMIMRISAQTTQREKKWWILWKKLVKIFELNVNFLRVQNSFRGENGNILPCLHRPQPDFP